MSANLGSRQGLRSVRLRPAGAAAFGAVAQLVERLLCKEEVRSSSLLGSTARTELDGRPQNGISFEVRAGFSRLEDKGDQNQLPQVCSIPRTRTYLLARELERASGAP